MHFAFEAIGTTWQIDLFTDLSKSQQRQLRQKITNRIEIFDQHYSRFRTDSLVSQMAQKAGDYALHSDAKKLFDFYSALYKISGGTFSPCIGQMLVDAGYDANYTLQQKKALSTPPNWNEFRYSAKKIKLNKPVLLDFGAAGKGYLLDLIAKLLREEKLQHFCLDAGGDLYYQGNGQKTLRVGLEDPNNANRVLGVFELEQGGLAASAGNRRKWGKFHHIINPITKKSPSKILATWVNATEAMLADGLATALFLTDPKKLRSEYNFGYLIVYDDSSVEKSVNFKAELFS